MQRGLTLRRNGSIGAKAEDGVTQLLSEMFDSISEVSEREGSNTLSQNIVGVESCYKARSNDWNIGEAFNCSTFLADDHLIFTYDRY